MAGDSIFGVLSGKGPNRIANRLRRDADSDGKRELPQGGAAISAHLQRKQGRSLARVCKFGASGYHGAARTHLNEERGFRAGRGRQCFSLLKLFVVTCVHLNKFTIVDSEYVLVILSFTSALVHGKFPGLGEDFQKRCSCVLGQFTLLHDLDRGQAFVCAHPTQYVLLQLLFKHTVYEVHCPINCDLLVVA